MNFGVKPARRMGPAGSENWNAMLDGAERILRDEGHAALTSRRVADEIGVKQRLIYYYFATMDELIVQTFRQLSERELLRLREATASSRPLREIWAICMHSTDARLIAEFMALANRIAPLAEEVVHFVEESRALQVKALGAALQRSGAKLEVPLAGLALFATSTALTLTRESQLGIAAGHAEALDLIERLLGRLEPDPA